MRTSSIGITFAVLFLAGLSSRCVTRTVTLTYRPSVAPTAATAKASAQVAVGDFTDNRHEPPNWIGAIRGGYGNPLKKLETDKPVSELVKEAFRQALVARALFSETGQVILSAWIETLDGNQYVRKQANVKLRVVVTDRQTQRELLNRPVTMNRVEGSLMAMNTGVFATVEELQAVIERALSQAIDDTLDSAAFRDTVPVTLAQSQQSRPSFRNALRVGMALIDLTAIAPQPVSAVDRLNENGVVVGKTFTYQEQNETTIVIVENGVVTSVTFK